VGAICGYTGPDGLAISPLCNLTPTVNISGGDSGSTLVGKIGEQGTPFPIGNGLEMTAPEEGTLFLRINTDTWLKYCGIAGKPGSKRRKQTAT
jgi:hypothetical protein